MGRRPTGISAKQTPADSRLAGVCLCCTNFTLPTGNLDSTSTIEIMELFTQLNREGVTVIIVTHEDDVAAFTDRVLWVEDGQLVDDRKVEK